MDEEQREMKRGSLLALGIWVALGLFLGRAGLVVVIDHLGHGIDLRGSLWRLNRMLATVIPFALAGGLGAALVASIFAGRRDAGEDGSRGSRTALVMRAVLGTALLCAFIVLFVSGFGLDQDDRVPGIHTENGVRAWIALFAGGLLCAVLLLIVARRRSAPALRFFCGSLRSALLPFLLIGLSPVLVYVALLGQGTMMNGLAVKRALLEGTQSWEVLSEHPAEAPSVGVITPVVDWRVSGGERPALIMPPGSEVRFRVEPEDGAVVLRANAGADQKIRERLKRGDAPLHFEFFVSVNNEIVFEEVLILEAGMDELANHWHPVAEKGGIELKPGDEVVLRTALAESMERGPGTDRAFRIGFSNLDLEREWQSPRTRSSSEAPNLILIVQDTLRRDRLGCYGYGRNTSPHLDRLAERGVLYEEAYATSSWTWPSTTSILTGLLSPTHGVLTGTSCYLPNGIDTVSEVLQRAGYTTIGISGNPLISSSKNFDQGFETFYDSASSFRPSELFMPSALDWIRMNAGTRFFMYLHLVDTHDPHPVMKTAREELVGPKPDGFNSESFHNYVRKLRKGQAYTADGEWDVSPFVSEAHREYLSKLYDGCVATGDFWVGEVLDTLDELELTGETVIALTSDHGEELFDHGMLAHSHSVFGELVRAPLVLAGPMIPKGVRSSVPISNRHLAETLALLGGGRMEFLEDGLNLAAPDRLPRKPVLFSTYMGWWKKWSKTPIHGIRSEEWVLHFAPEAGEFGTKVATPSEQSLLYELNGVGTLEGARANNPEREAELKSSLIESLERLEQARTQYSIESGEETRGMLEGIGYIESESEE